ncbi:MAG: hypothetical protein JXA52_05870 [Planctomycetes bacterium]|nr:hypothetical protein [Planctomycetota bacterium]
MLGKQDREPIKIFRWWMIPLGFVIIFAFAIAMLRMIAASQVEERMAAFRAQGYLTTLAEWEEWYNTPPLKDNAAEIYQQAFDALVDWYDDENKSKQLDNLPFAGSAKLPLNAKPIPEEMREVIVEFLTENKEALKLLYQAAEKPECRYPVDFSDAWFYLDDSVNVFDALNLLALDAVIHAEDGESEAVVNALIAASAVNRPLLSKPFSMNYFRFIINYYPILDAFEHALDRTLFAESQLVALNDNLIIEPDNKALLIAITNEIYGMHYYFNYVHDSPEDAREGLFRSDFTPFYVIRNPYLETLAVYSYSYSGAALLDLSCYLDFASQAIKVAKLPVEKRISELANLRAYWQSLPGYAYFAKDSCYSLECSIRNVLEHIARMRIAQVVIAIELYQLKYNRLPKELTEVTPDFLSVISLDPFDAKPLKYKLLDKGFIVYSIGRDQTDDGGYDYRRNEELSRSSDGVDITFTVERADLVK